MQVRNVHTRRLDASASAGGALLDTAGSENNRLWPRNWPRMKFDQPLRVGVHGGHGPIRYFVEAYEPGKRVQFRFTGPRGFEGYHALDVEPEGDSACVLRHVIEMEARGVGILSWTVVFRPLHDALIEDLLDRAERELELGTPRTPWSPWVRLLRWVLR